MIFLRHILTGTDNHSFELAETLIASLAVILVVFTVWDYWVRGHDWHPEVTIGAGAALVTALGCAQRLRGDNTKPSPPEGS